MRTSILLIICTIFFQPLMSQEIKEQDKAVYKERQAGFYQQTIKKNFEQLAAEEQSVPKYFGVDFSDQDFPTDLDDYKIYWHNNPISQGATGTCWSFATISFFESEIFRLKGEKVKLSEMYIAYWEYVERAKSFVKNRGEIYFAQGSEATGVLRIIKNYGIVTLSDYEGKPEGQEFHNHSVMFREMKSYLDKVKQDNAWDEKTVVGTIKSILNHYMGKPPKKIDVDGKATTPTKYLSNVLGIDIYDYYSFMSTMSLTYNQKGELVEADNWWHCDDYYNISLDDYFKLIKTAVEKGFTMSICGDVSEPGHDSFAEISIIPTFDIPSDYINKASREYRLNNRTTTDDHCIHIVGYYNYRNSDWFLIKDSGAGGFDGPNKGYRFMHEDYIKLKMMNVMVHKDGASIILDNIIK